MPVVVNLEWPRVVLRMVILVGVFFLWSWHDLIVRGTWLAFCSQVLLVMSDLVRSYSLLFPVVESRLLV